MTTRKQIRVYVDADQWTALKADHDQTDTDTLKQLLTELEQLRSFIGQLAHQDIGQLNTMVSALSEVHTNPLIALGICLERYRQIELGQVLQVNEERSPPAADNFIDNSGDF